MKQVVQRPRDGVVSVIDVPEPRVEAGWVLVETVRSLISVGTERAKIETGNKNLVQKARARPDLARKVIDEARVAGVRSTLSKVRDRLDAQAPIGYSCSGVVRAVGVGVDGIAPGVRVACGGAGWANHAELVSVPKHLVAPLPEGVGFDAGAYATVGSIALHGVRQAEAALGEAVAVIGLGLVGQLAVRILLAAGCRVIGIDLDPNANQLAAAAGATTAVPGSAGLDAAVRELTRGLGVDSALVCAASKSAAPLALAARISRDRGRVVIVGDVPVEADRALLYDKELELRLSRSYGPGRYDVDYEQRGHDLPAGYVRWTEQRNLAAFLDLVALGRLDVDALTTHRFPVERAADAYDALGQSATRPFGVLLEYSAAAPRRLVPAPVTTRPAIDRVGVGFIGAGNFARTTLVPAFATAGADLVAVASATGLTAADAAVRLGFSRASTVDEILSAADVDAIVVATRHGDHAELTAAGLAAGKAVFVEKPLALTWDELASVEAAMLAESILMVGFNRRYAPLAVRLREELGGVADKVVTARVNAGPLPADHWLHDPRDGGGRILGEGCHFVDLLASLAESPIDRVHAIAVPQPERPIGSSDTVVASLGFASGAVGSLVYAGGGDTGLPKERVEAFGGGLAAVIDDFRRLELIRNGRRDTIKEAQDKGHRAEVRAFVSAVGGTAPPPAVSTYLNSMRATLALAESLATGLVVEVA